MTQVTNAVATVATAIKDAGGFGTMFPKEMIVSSFIPTALNGLGKALKAVPWFPNYAIPFALAAAGTVAFCMVAGWSQINGVVGCCFAAAAVLNHQSLRNDTPTGTQ